MPFTMPNYAPFDASGNMGGDFNPMFGSATDELMSGYDPGSLAGSFDPSKITSSFKMPNFGATAGGMGGAGGGSPFGFNVPTANLALTGLSTLGQLWGAFQMQKLAKQQFNFTKQMGTANLANQISSYNTTLADRGRSRAMVEGQSPEQAQGYIDQNKLTMPKGF